MRLLTRLVTNGALPRSDLALFSDPESLTGLIGTLPMMFAHGVAGYTDDRLADGPGC